MSVASEDPRRLRGSRLLVLQCCLFALACGLRFWRLDADLPALQNADDLGDEGYWFIGARDLLRFGALDPGSNFHQAEAGAPLTLAWHAAIARLTGSISYVQVRAFTAGCSVLLLALGAFYLQVLRKSPKGATLFLALYGLLPLTVFYSRLAFVEPHVLLFLTLGFVLLEIAGTPRGWVLAGLALSLAVAAKAVAVFALPAAALYLAGRHRRTALRPLAWVALGAAPVGALLAAHLFVHRAGYGPTWTALASYHSYAGFFIDRFSLGYFWRRPLVLPLVPWLLLGAGLSVGRAVGGRKLPHWALLWAAVALVGLSLFRYQTFARHQLLVFPLTLLAALEVGALLEGPVLPRTTALLASLGAVAGLLATLVLGRAIWLAPTFTYRDATETLAALTSPEDRVVGVHAFGLSLPGSYRPRMSLNTAGWRDVDPLARVRPTVALVPEVFNGHAGAGPVFPQRDQFAAVEQLERLEYLGRFRTAVLRVFESEAEHQLFLRYRQGRASRYDSLLDHLYRERPEVGCAVKGLRVAESRGDAGISHRKISTTGCLGMFGFWLAAAREQPDLFPRLGGPLRPGVVDEARFLADDRFDPLRSMRAAERHLGRLRQQFSALRERDRLAFAAYNAGAGFVARLVALSGKADPGWDEDLLPLLRSPELARQAGYGGFSAEERRHKFGYEIPHYVDDAWGTMRACLANARWQIADIAEPVPSAVAAGVQAGSGG